MTNRSRLTLDMTSEQHAYIKMTSVKLGITMREFILAATLEKIEDEWLADKAQTTLNDITSGQEKTISWADMKKRIS